MRALERVNPPGGRCRLRFFLYLVVALFGGMHLVAAAAAVRDARDIRTLLAAVKEPALGFAEAGADKAWTWRIQQDPLRAPADGGVESHVAGTAVALAALIGLPFARIRCAIPDDLLVGTLAAATGRAGGMRASWLKAVQAGGAAAPAPAIEAPPASGGEGHHGHHGHHGGKAHGPEYASLQQLMVGTALVYAFMAVRSLLPPAALAGEMAKSARVFAGVKEPRGRGFGELRMVFTSLLFAANMPQGKQWLARARMWQLILLQARARRARGAAAGVLTRSRRPPRVAPAARGRPLRAVEQPGVRAAGAR